MDVEIAILKLLHILRGYIGWERCISGVRSSAGAYQGRATAFARSDGALIRWYRQKSEFTGDPHRFRHGGGAAPS